MSGRAAALLLRADRYASLHADPHIFSRTHFFAAAASVTRALAQRPASAFMFRLSEWLEAFNEQQAHQIRKGHLYVHGAVDENTADFVRQEQTLVQLALDALRARSAEDYRRQIAWANESVRMARVWWACSRKNSCFARALASTLRLSGGHFDFAHQRDREALGQQLARHAAMSAALSPQQADSP